jgi:hypothetical protein
MRLPSNKKLLREDFNQAPPWIDGLLVTLNSFMESVYTALNKNVTFGDNIASFVKELSYITPTTYPNGVSNVSFLNQLKVKAIGVSVLQVYETQTYLAPPGPVYAPWIESEGSITVSAITGLEASKTYLIRLVVF